MKINTILRRVTGAVIAVACGALTALGVFGSTLFTAVVDTATAFILRILPSLSSYPPFAPLITYVLLGGFAAACVGGVLLAFNSRFTAGLLSAAVLIILSLMSADIPSIAAVALGGCGCAAGLWVYTRLAKKLPSVFNRETVSYIVFGVLTTVVSFVSQMLFATLGTPAWLNTIGSWVCAVIFAYVVNKLFVFESHTDSAKAFFKELGLFFSARLASLGMEIVFMFVCVDLLGFSEAVCKLIAQVFILVANYIFSKLVIFKKNDA